MRAWGCARCARGGVRGAHGDVGSAGALGDVRKRALHKELLQKK